MEYKTLFNLIKVKQNMCRANEGITTAKYMTRKRHSSRPCSFTAENFKAWSRRVIFCDNRFKAEKFDLRLKFRSTFFQILRFFSNYWRVTKNAYL